MVIQITAGNEHRITGITLASFEQAAKGCRWTAHQFDETLDQATTVCIGAYSLAGDLTGYCLLMRLDDDDLELLQMTVASNERRQGIGRALLVAVVNYAKQQSFSRVLLEVNVHNEAAISLYQQSGFEIDGKRKDYYAAENGKREDAFLMSLLLTD